MFMINVSAALSWFQLINTCRSAGLRLMFSCADITSKVRLSGKSPLGRSQCVDLTFGPVVTLFWINVEVEKITFSRGFTRKRAVKDFEIKNLI